MPSLRQRFTGRWVEPGDAPLTGPHRTGPGWKGAELGGPVCHSGVPAGAGIWPWGSRGSRRELGERGDAGSPWSSPGAGPGQGLQGQAVAGAERGRDRGRGQPRAGSEGRIRAHGSCHPADRSFESATQHPSCLPPRGPPGERGPLAVPSRRLRGFWLRGLGAARSTLLFKGPGRPAAHSPSRTPRPRAVTLPTTAAASVVFQQQALAPLLRVPSTALSWSMPSEQVASGVNGRRRKRRSLGWTVTCP